MFLSVILILLFPLPSVQDWENTLSSKSTIVAHPHWPHIVSYFHTWTTYSLFTALMLNIDTKCQVMGRMHYQQHMNTTAMLSCHSGTAHLGWKSGESNTEIVDQIYTKYQYANSLQICCVDLFIYQSLRRFIQFSSTNSRGTNYSRKTTNDCDLLYLPEQQT